MGSLRNERRSRLSWAVGASLAVATASVLAASPKSTPKPATITQTSELMTFANVKVVNAAEVTPSAKKQSSKDSATEQGLRVYVDPSSKRIREQTNEDVLQIVEESKAKVAAKSAIRSRSRGASLAGDEAGAGELEMIYGPGNAVGVNVGDDALVYQVVRKTNSGLTTAEYNGKKAAEKSLKTKVSAEEVNHER